MDEIKALVVDDKWLATLAASVQGELDRVSQNLTARIRQLAERYAAPLPKLKKVKSAAAASVRVALQAMARQTGLGSEVDHLAFQLQSVSGPKRHIHVLKGRKLVGDGSNSVVRVVALIATEEDGQLIHVRRLHSR